MRHDVNERPLGHPVVHAGHIHTHACVRIQLANDRVKTQKLYVHVCQIHDKKRKQSLYVVDLQRSVEDVTLGAFVAAPALALSLIRRSVHARRVLPT